MKSVDRKLRVFLCHSSTDKPIVRELYQRLLAEGWIDPWLDVKELLPGQDWRISISEAVESAHAVIICLSNNSVAKEGYIQKEMRYAQEISLEKPEGTIFLIPLRLEECDVPRGLRFFQWTDYFSEKKEQNYSILVKSLKSRLEQILQWEKEESNKAQQEEQLLHERSGSHLDYAQKVFNDRLPARYTLPSISIEAPGVLSTPLYYSGTPLPFQQSFIFSTFEDNQSEIEFKLLLGENKYANENVLLGKYLFEGISPAPKTIPQIELLLEINEKLILSIKATELSTNRTKKFDTASLKNIAPPAVKNPFPRPQIQSNSQQGVPSNWMGRYIKELLTTDPFPFQPRTGNDIHLPLELTYEEAAIGIEKEIETDRFDYCSLCYGSGTNPETVGIRCSVCGGQGKINSSIKTIFGDLIRSKTCPSCKGGCEAPTQPCEKCQGNGIFHNSFQTRVSLPKNLANYATIKLVSAGHAGRNRWPRGNIYLHISLR